MPIMMIVSKSLFLFMAVFFTLVNTGRMMSKQDLPFGNFIWQSVGVTGFIVLQWLL